MITSIPNILMKMEQTLSLNKLARPTALKGLQAEEHHDPFKILIGTILSARTIEEIKTIIHSIGFYNIKAKRIKEVSQLIVERFNGEVPDDIQKLLELPGVGRKTANCVLVYGFNKAAIPVDIHVHRISNRLGLVNTKTPEKTEIELSRIISKKYWPEVNQTFVMYGQNI